ncbi:MAG: sensor histidine kinase, partial [Planctomycetota bacterium]
PDAAGFVDQAEATVGSMRQTIDDLLELSRVGRTPNRITRVALGPLVEEVLRTHAVAIGRAGIRVHVDGELPEIEADRRRLTQVLDNLVANAIAYGCGPEVDDPRIEIAAACDEDACVLCVRDHGPGVPEAFAEQVFGLFQRLRQDRPGTGVGLALVRRIVDAHGGRVWVEPAAGGGARFCIRLPRVPPHAAGDAGADAGAKA